MADSSGMRFLIGSQNQNLRLSLVPTWVHGTELHRQLIFFFFFVKTFKSSKVSVYSQVGDPCFPHSAGDGLHGRAQGVQQRGQLPGAFRLPALLHDEPGHGDHVGVECSSVGHNGSVGSNQSESGCCGER